MGKSRTIEPVDHVARLRGVLAAMGIKRASFVDDKFSPSFETAIARSLALASTKSADLVSSWGVGTWGRDSVDDDRRDAKTAWDVLDVPGRIALLKRLSTLGNGNYEEHLFSEFWPATECPMDTLGPEGFGDDYIRESLLRDGPSILFLDLNFTDGQDKEGLTLLSQVLRLDTERKTVCVIFTREPGANGVDFWTDLANGAGIEPGAAVVISKSATEDVATFEASLRRALLNGLGPELLRWASSIANSALKKATTATRLEGDVINAAVLQSSEKEGIHPTETLFRLIDAEFRREREQLVNVAIASGEFKGFRSKLEALATITPADDTDPPLSMRVRKLMREHLYRSYISPAEWPPPLWLGDLWEVCLIEGAKEATQQFVLVAQPCDIILRASDGARSQQWALLVPLRKDRGSHPETVVEFKYYDEVKYESRYAYLKHARLANANVLDATALIGSPLRRVDVASLRSRAHVHVAVEKRLANLCDWLEAAKAGPPLSAGPSNSRDAVGSGAVEPSTAGALLDSIDLRELALFHAPGSSAKLSITSDLIDFHCKRIGRVEVEFSRLLLQRYGNFVARHALAHDFADYQKK